MAQRDITFNDVYHNGTHTFGVKPAFPNASIKNAHVDTTDPLDIDKIRRAVFARLAQVHGSNATAERRIVHVARSAGTLLAVQVVPIVAATGDSTVTVDVYKNGVSVLTGTVSLDNSKAAYSKTLATLSVTAYTAGDVFEVVQTISAGTGTLPHGVCTQLTFNEGAA
jgi:hypothetical protein